MTKPQDYRRGHRSRRQQDGDDESTTPNIQIHWESQMGAGQGRRTRTASYLFILFGTALAAFIVLALIMLYSMGTTVSG